MRWERVDYFGESDYRLFFDNSISFAFASVSSNDHYRSLYYSIDGRISIMLCRVISASELKAYLDLAEEAWCTDDLEDVWETL